MVPARFIIRVAVFAMYLAVCSSAPLPFAYHSANPEAAWYGVRLDATEGKEPVPMHDEAAAHPFSWNITVSRVKDYVSRMDIEGERRANEKLGDQEWQRKKNKCPLSAEAILQQWEDENLE